MSWKRNYLILTLPDTDVAGARQVARRFTNQFNAREFNLDDFCVTVPVEAGIHCADPEHPESPQQLISETVYLLAGEDQAQTIRLSPRARASRSVPRESLEGKLQTLLHDSGSQHFLDALAPELSRLDEPQRMALIDQLLDASTRPPSALAGH